MKNINKNNYLITTDFLRYLPSRFYVLTNIFLILPFFANLLSIKEMGTFQICISILNLICTIFFDWIAKAVLRFYDKNKLQESLNKFFDNIIILYITNYFLFGILYLIFHGKMCEYLYIDRLTLFSIMILVIPCIIRQFLYQMLRLYGMPVLYTASIIIYQLLLVIITILFVHIGFNNVSAILTSMALAITILDFYIFKKIKRLILQKNNNNTLIKFEIDIIKKILKYGIPLVCTNFFIWGLFHYNKYFFQSSGNFNATGEFSLAAFITTGILTSIFSTMLFAVFPRILKRFETQRNLSALMTNLVRLYILYFVPLALIFCIFTKDLVTFFSTDQYKEITNILPFWAVCIFIHELGKIINVKYHLYNKNYIDTLVAMVCTTICIAITYPLVNLFGIKGAAIAMTIGFVTWIATNSLIKINNIKYIDYKAILVCLAVSLILSTAAYTITQPIKLITSSYVGKIVQILVFTCSYYYLLYKFRKTILK